VLSFFEGRAFTRKDIFPYRAAVHRLNIRNSSPKTR